MLVFTSALFFFGVLHIAIGRAKHFLCDRFVITPENIGKFNFDDYLMAYQLASNYNMNHGDSDIKDCLIKSMQNIEIYYTNITDNTNFEAFKAVPYIIHMLGRDYSEDTKSFWIASGIMFKIIHKVFIDERLSRIVGDKMNSSISHFSNNCVPYGIRGISDQAFFHVFPTVDLQKKILELFLSTTEDRKAEILAFYLTRCSLTRDQLEIVTNLIDTQKFDFSFEIFSQTAAEVTYAQLVKKLDGRKLLSLYNYAVEKKLLPKTHLLIMKRVLI